MKRVIPILIAGFLFTAVSANAAILVVSTKGEAAYMVGSQWKPLTKGLKLAEGTKISTGVKSNAILDIDGTIMTVKPLTSIKIYKNSATADAKETSVGLQFGAVQAKVDKVARVKTKFNITTPVATSSVRGTNEVVSFGPASGMRIQVIEGVIGAANGNGVNKNVSGRMSFRQKTDQSRPDSLLADVKEGSTVEIAAGGQDVEDGKDFTDELDNLSTSKVSITIIWP
jgi:hypothetical protein